MNTNINAAIIVAVVIGLAMVGCKKEPPGLTGRQVDQFLNTQEKLANEQTALGRGRDSLEADRRRWAERERQDPIIAESIQGAVVLIACSLPMFIVAVLLWPKRNSDASPAIDTPELIELLSRDDLLIVDQRHPKSPTALPSDKS